VFKQAIDSQFEETSVTVQGGLK